MLPILGSEKAPSVGPLYDAKDTGSATHTGAPPFRNSFQSRCLYDSQIPPTSTAPLLHVSLINPRGCPFPGSLQADLEMESGTCG